MDEEQKWRKKQSIGIGLHSDFDFDFDPYQKEEQDRLNRRSILTPI